MSNRPPRKRWLPAEDEIIREGYPNYALLQKQLPDRTGAGIKYRASLIGVVKKRHRWTGREMRELAQLRAEGATWPQIERLYPGRSLLRAMRYLKKVPRRPTLLGLPLLDDIRQRAFDHGINLTELDKRASSGTYFQHCNRYESLGPIERAAIILGGELAIEWSVE